MNRFHFSTLQFATFYIFSYYHDYRYSSFHHRAFPGNKHIFYITFASSHAIVLHSVYFYRLSLTFHSVERMAGAHVHFAPCLLMFSIRWYPDVASSKWYTNFAEVNLDEMTGSTLWFWLVVAPMGCFMCHTVSYASL